jgi:HEAT repeat protein
MTTFNLRQDVRTEKTTENTTMKTSSKTTLMAAAALTLALGMAVPAGPAQAGRGGSPDRVQRAIASGSVDAISAELERTERLVCSGCIGMVRPLIDHQDGRVRRVASWWLARRGMRSELFIEAAYRLAQPDSVKARNAADVLGSLRYHKAVEPLGAALNNPVFDAEARVAMAAALGRIGEPSAAPALSRALADQQPLVRAEALAALRELRGPLDARPAVPLLRDGTEAVRIEAVYTIGATRGLHLDGPARAAAVSGLLERLRFDTSASVRRKAAWALGEIGAPAAGVEGPLRLAATRDHDPSVRSLANAAVSKLTR